MTSIIILRGFLSFWTNSLIEWAPTMDFPLASFSRNRSTFDTVRLKAMTVKPGSCQRRRAYGLVGHLTVIGRIQDQVLAHCKYINIRYS